jgi:uncharacterized protein (TIGR02145 family)
MKRALYTVSALIAISPVQALHLTGVVKNSAGSGLEGVKVRLGKAAITTTTASDGSFTLTDGTGLKRHGRFTDLSSERPIILAGNKLVYHAGEQANVSAAAYDCAGKLVYARQETVYRGNHSLTLPRFGSGVRIFRISVDNKQYGFKSVAGVAADRRAVSSGGENGIAGQAKAAGGFDDALLFIKQGYRFHRIALTKPDTAGLQIALSPLDTGTVTDADGNAYRTVRIGNQNWTAENLRSTKYNDGSGIGSGCQFYNNTTDATAKKKWGALYTIAAVKSGKLAPTGWRVPTNADWDTLQNYLISQGYNYDGTASGNKIAKSIAATTDWQASVETGAVGNDLTLNNASGFSALPAGWLDWEGSQFRHQQARTYWWSATQYDATYQYVRDLWYINFDLDRSYYTIVQCSVRLIKNS